MSAGGSAIAACTSCRGARAWGSTTRSCFACIERNARLCGGRKRALGTRARLAIPQGSNQRWSTDFVQDVLTDGRRFRIWALVDDFSRECLALIADTSISGRRVARELDRVAELRGRPCMIVSDNGTEFTSNAMLS